MSLRSAISALLRADSLESCIDSGETVVFFPTAASAEGGVWQIPIHGWIYKGAELSRLRRTAAGLLRGLAGLRLRPSHLQRPMFQQRLGAFLADNERNNRVQIALGGTTFVLGKSHPNGHFEGMLTLHAEQVRALMVEGGGSGPWLTYRAVTRSRDPRQFDGRVVFLPAEGVSVISDIDDTIKVTEVLDRRRMLANTFVREFRSVSGMAEVYGRWARERGAAFHYVSASPWHLYPFLAEFLAAQGFPAGTFHLRDFRLMPRDLRATLRSTGETKRRHARELMKRFPRRKFVLVGDSGEWDPEIYAGLAREFPGQVERILIRNVTGEGEGAARWRRVFAGVARGKWRVFSEAAELE
jgi:phosphatidate phosphatase APP1